jgi:hypothetical protein
MSSFRTLGRRASFWVAAAVMRVAGRKVSIEPVPGRLLVMNWQRSLHSVTAVRGGADRVNVVMSFDDDEVAARSGDELDMYLYSSQPVSAGDPNHVSRNLRSQRIRGQVNDL